MNSSCGHKSSRKDKRKQITFKISMLYISNTNLEQGYTILTQQNSVKLGVPLMPD